MEYAELKEELAEIAKILPDFPENLRDKVFDLLIATYRGEDTPIDRDEVEEKAPEGALPKDAPKKGGAKRVPESYKLDKELNLRGKGDIPPFAKFVADKKPKSSAEFNAVAVYYLCRRLNLKSATLDQIYTCYDEAKRKPAGYFRQSIIDTKISTVGWILARTAT
jgi:hypothetical protein